MVTCQSQISQFYRGLCKSGGSSGYIQVLASLLHLAAVFSFISPMCCGLFLSFSWLPFEFFLVLSHQGIWDRFPVPVKSNETWHMQNNFSYMIPSPVNFLGGHHSKSRSWWCPPDNCHATQRWFGGSRSISHLIASNVTFAYSLTILHASANRFAVVATLECAQPRTTCQIHVQGKDTE